jgi:AP-2 complex subunit sigma-1
VSPPDGNTYLVIAYIVIDAFFQNVCELDLVFSFYKVSHMPFPGCTSVDTDVTQVYAILDEVFLAGEIEETSKQVVLDRLDFLEKLE